MIIILILSCGLPSLYSKTTRNAKHFQYDAKKKECDTIQCDREVALLALKQSIESQSGEPLQKELDSLKNKLKEYEVRDEEYKQECQQVIKCLFFLTF